LFISFNHSIYNEIHLNPLEVQFNNECYALIKYNIILSGIYCIQIYTFI